MYCVLSLTCAQWGWSVCGWVLLHEGSVHRNTTCHFSNTDLIRGRAGQNSGPHLYKSIKHWVRVPNMQCQIVKTHCIELKQNKKYFVVKLLKKIFFALLHFFLLMGRLMTSFLRSTSPNPWLPAPRARTWVSIYSSILLASLQYSDKNTIIGHDCTVL